MTNVRAEIVTGKYKDGNTWTGVQFYIMTSQGEYRSQVSFPTPLELELVKKAISPVKAIYSDDNQL